MTSLHRRVAFVLVSCGLAAAACKTTDPTPSPGADPPGSDSGAGAGAGPDAGGGGTAAMFGPLDPGFTGTPAAAWRVSGGATIETWVPPGVDPGVARFDPSKLQGVAFVAQTFSMPAYAPTTQYALETTGVGNGVHARIDNMTLGDLLLGGAPSKIRICLGERAYGHDINLAFGSRLAGTVFDTVDSITWPSSARSTVRRQVRS